MTTTPPPPPPPNARPTVVVNRTTIQRVEADPDPRVVKLADDVGDLKAQIAVLNDLIRRTPPKVLSRRYTAAHGGSAVRSESLTRVQPTQSENYYVTQDPEGLLDGPLGMIAIAEDRGIAYFKTTPRGNKWGWREMLLQGSSVVGTGNMTYRDEIDAANLPALPDPSVSFGDAWRIAVAGQSHGIMWNVGDLAVVGLADQYDRIGSPPYRPDLEIPSFTVSPSVMEYGNRVSSASFSWNLSRDDISAQSIASPAHTTQRPDPADRAYVWNFATPVGTTTQFTLNVQDSEGDSKSRNAYLYYRWRRYWGANANPTISDAELLSLDSELSTTRVQVRRIVPAGRYLYLAWPAAWGQGDIFVGRLPDTSWNLEQRTLVNSHGASAQYLVYRSEQAAAGTENIEVEVQ